MSSNERLQLPLRWQFVPLQQERDGAVRWKWRAFTQVGTLALESEREFETLTECMEAARAAGYGAS